jgi:hypothetical protein
LSFEDVNLILLKVFLAWPSESSFVGHMFFRSLLTGSTKDSDFSLICLIFGSLLLLTGCLLYCRILVNFKKIICTRTQWNKIHNPTPMTEQTQEYYGCIFDTIGKQYISYIMAVGFIGLEN